MEFKTVFLEINPPLLPETDPQRTFPITFSQFITRTKNYNRFIIKKSIKQTAKFSTKPTKKSNAPRAAFQVLHVKSGEPRNVIE